MKKSLKIVAMSLLSLVSFGINAQNAKKANDLFQNGDFIESQKVYQEILNTRPNDLNSLIFMGYTALLLNQLDDAERWILFAKKLKPNQSTLNYFLSEIYHRQLQFSKAAPYYRSMGREAMARKMESFAHIQPYEMGDDFEEVRIQFVITDPLPVIEVVVNNDYKGYFIIDTGGGELILNDVLAKKITVSSFGEEKGNGFAGGKKATIRHGSINAITLGELEVKNIPTVTLNLHELEIGGYKIDGIIGTVFLYQFLSTIDYKNGLLILRNKTKFDRADITKNSTRSMIIPFALADDHYMLAKGKVNSSDSLLFFVDTGLAGNSFTCPKTTLKKSGLKIDKSKKEKAMGGGGHFTSFPMEIDSICIGDLCVGKLHGVYGAFPYQIEKSFGFTIDGLVSHEFFRNYSLSIDFHSMKYIVSE